MIAYPVLITCGRKYIISLLMLDIRKFVPKLKISFTVSDIGHIKCPTVRKLCMKYVLSCTESKYEMLFYMSSMCPPL